jgi:high-affinity iron transporter
MFATFMITLREGIEAFLIVAITLAYLRKTGRTWLAPAVYGATTFAVALSFGAARLFQEADNKPLWEGILAAVAALMVLSMVIYMSSGETHAFGYCRQDRPCSGKLRLCGTGWRVRFRGPDDYS